MFSTTWKSTDGILSHCKYVLDEVIVYRVVYHAPLISRLAQETRVGHALDSNADII